MRRGRAKLRMDSDLPDTTCVPAVIPVQQDVLLLLCVHTGAALMHAQLPWGLLCCVLDVRVGHAWLRPRG